MFEYLKEISTPGSAEYQPHFTLVLLDLKIKTLNENAKRVAGTLLADKLINILFESEQGLSKLKVIAGLEMVADYPFVWTFVDRFNQRGFSSLLDRVGFDVSGKPAARLRSVSLDARFVPVIMVIRFDNHRANRNFRGAFISPHRGRASRGARGAIREAAFETFGEVDGEMPETRTPLMTSHLFGARQ